MSRGLGRLERAIVAYLADEERSRSELPVLVSSWSLTFSIHAPPHHVWNWRPTLAQRKATLRAMHSVVRKFPRYGLMGGRGRKVIYLVDRDDPRSVHWAECMLGGRSSVPWREAIGTLPEHLR